MKDRRNIQVLDGFRQSSGKRRTPQAALAQAGSVDNAESLRLLLIGQIEENLAVALKASEERLSSLLHDRSRIGQELHDSVLHALYAIGASLSRSSQFRTCASPASSASQRQAGDQLHQLIHDIRRMILGVQADRVEPFNLVSELRFLAHTCEQMSQARISVNVEPAAEEVLTSEEAHELSFIAGEALNNCVRHAQATEIVIGLRRIGSRIRLRIRDNGSGFDLAREQTRGMGFAHMKSRVRKIGGRLEIQSTRGRGTCITADIFIEPILTTI